MTTKELEQALIVAKQAVIDAGKVLSQHFGKVDSHTKSETLQSATNIVTQLDYDTELLIARQLKQFNPRIGFHGEEFGAQSDSNTKWLVDPIDGTSHFVRGLPFSTTMISLVENGVVLLAIIYDFVHEDIYWAVKGQGAYKNDERLHVSNRPLRGSLLSFDTKLTHDQNRDLYLQLQKETSGLFSTINSGFEYAMIASGKLDGRITKDPYGYDWDYAPGSLLVAEAGGVVVNIGKKTYDYTNHDFLAVNPTVYHELTKGPKALFPLNEKAT